MRHFPGAHYFVASTQSLLCVKATRMTVPGAVLKLGPATLMGCSHVNTVGCPIATCDGGGQKSERLRQLAERQVLAEDVFGCAVA